MPKQVTGVILTGGWPLLRGGVVLVDTPGAGSIHQHNTVAARHALLGRRRGGRGLLR